MTNTEKQSDEILALQSIFDEKFHLLDENQFEISIEFDLITPITIRLHEQSSIIQYLPPFDLIIQYHEEYPSDCSPSFILSCFYFSKSKLQKLCQKLDNYPFNEGQVCVYDWIELIKLEIDSEMNLQTPSEDEYDPRVLNGYVSEESENIFHYLINYNHQRANEQFQKQFQTCLICADDIRGAHCIRLHRCRHFYCRSCLNNYVRRTLNNGQFGEKLLCPQNQCKQPLLPTEVKEIIQDEQLYENYERLTLQHSLELMNDILWCPRCQYPVVVDSGADNLAVCEQCRYAFCKQCKRIFHSQTACLNYWMMEQSKLSQRRMTRALPTEAAKQGKESKVEKSPQITTQLLEEQSLFEEILSAGRIESLNTQLCPKCHIQIEKNGGCSHMHCSRCNHHFTWGRALESENSNSVSLLDSLMHNFMQLSSSNKVSNKATNIAKQEPAHSRDTDSAQKEDDDNVSIDNKITTQDAIANRVKRCPSKSCKKFNMKMDQDNWMVCRKCMKQYCFVCGRVIHGKAHFAKKCKRNTHL